MVPWPQPIFGVSRSIYAHCEAGSNINFRSIAREDPAGGYIFKWDLSDMKNKNIY